MPRKLFITILLFIIISSICAAWATYFLKPLLKKKILEVLEKGIEERVELSRLDVSLLKGIIYLKGFGIVDPKFMKYHSAVTAGEIILDIDLLSYLLRKNLVFQKIHLKNFTFNIKNRKRPTSLIEPLSPVLEGAEKRITSQKRTQDMVYIKQFLIEDSKFVFTDYSVAPSPTVIEIVNINGKIEDLSVPLFVGGALKGTARLKGELNSKDEGSLSLDGSFAKDNDTVNFDFKVDLDDVSLIKFSPYYSNTSFKILKEAKLDIESNASCLENRINASQNARIYDIELYDTALTGEDTLFGLPAKTVLEFFEDLRGDIKFNFNIVGTIDDLQFDPGPIIEQVLSNAMRDKIIAKLQELPREVIKMSEKALNENLKVQNKLKGMEYDIDEKIKDIKKKLNKIIDYNP